MYVNGSKWELCAKLEIVKHAQYSYLKSTDKTLLHSIAIQKKTFEFILTMA